MREAVTTVCLVRHGETDWNRFGRLQGREDVPLNDFGRAQADAAATSMTEDDWDAVYSSPLSRAMDTAIAIAAACGTLAPTPIPGLVERDYGLASGLTDEEVAAKFPDHNVPGMESRDEVRQRVLPVLQTIVSAHSGGRVIVVSHGGVIKSVLLGISRGKVPPDGQNLLNTSASLLEHERDSGFIVRYFNRPLATGFLRQAAG